MRIRTFLTIAAVAFLALSAPAGAGIIEIENPGFEAPIVSQPGDWSNGAPTGWTRFGPDTGEGWVGAWRVTGNEFYAQPDGDFAPEGRNVAWAETPLTDPGIVGLEQTLDTRFAVGADYTLTVEVGNADYNRYYWSGYSVQLLAGDIVIAEDYNTERPENMEWTTSSVEYSYDQGDSGLEGQFLAIRLLNLGLNPDNAYTKWWYNWSKGEWRRNSVGVEFDDVQLTTPTPEPATMLLLGAGLLGLAGFGRKKLLRK